MLLATVAIACLGNYIFRAAIVVRILIIYPLSHTPPPVGIFIAASTTPGPTRFGL